MCIYKFNPRPECGSVGAVRSKAEVREVPRSRTEWNSTISVRTAGTSSLPGFQDGEIAQPTTIIKSGTQLFQLRARRPGNFLTQWYQHSTLVVWAVVIGLRLTVHGGDLLETRLRHGSERSERNGRDGFGRGSRRNVRAAAAASSGGSLTENRNPEEWWVCTMWNDDR